MKHLAVIVLLLIVGCVAQPCSDYDYAACPSRCSLCGESMIDSRMLCHDNEYCATVTACSSISNLSECTGECSICPPCETCGALICQTSEHCEDMGFSNEWYERLQQS